jgi:hypothetical protein
MDSTDRWAACDCGDLACGSCGRAVVAADEPPVAWPRRCEWDRCRDEAVEGELCASHRVRQLVDDHEVQAAYAVARAYGLPESAVRRAIRDRDERKTRGAVAAMHAALRSLPAANDTAPVPPPAGLTRALQHAYLMRVDRAALDAAVRGDQAAWAYWDAVGDRHAARLGADVRRVLRRAGLVASLKVCAFDSAHRLVTDPCWWGPTLDARCDAQRDPACAEIDAKGTW